MPRRATGALVSRRQALGAMAGGASLIATPAILEAQAPLTVKFVEQRGLHGQRWRFPKGGDQVGSRSLQTVRRPFAVGRVARRTIAVPALMVKQPVFIAIVARKMSVGRRSGWGRSKAWCLS
jgi:hypothetical protein